MIALLGEAIDRDVAAELEIPVQSMTYKRRVQGISGFQPGGRRTSDLWTQDRVEVLGPEPDSLHAARWNITSAAVYYRRRVLRIPPHRPRSTFIEWTEEMRVGLVGLGSEPDGAVAERLGIGKHTVEKERKRLGIPPGGNRKRIVRSPELRHTLEQKSQHIAAESGIAVGTTPASGGTLRAATLAVSALDTGEPGQVGQVSDEIQREGCTLQIDPNRPADTCAAGL